MHVINKIRVFSTYETCERTTFYVELTSDEGFEMTPAGYATGSIYTNGEGLSIEEARDRALMDAADWGDFLGIPVEPFIVDGVAIEPSMRFEKYETRRILAQRRTQKDNLHQQFPIIE